MSWLPILALSVAASVEGGGDTSLDLRSCLDAPRPAIVVQVVSVQRMVRVALTPDGFDEFIKPDGPDYVLRIQDPERAKLVGEFLEALEIEDVRSGMDSVGVRYRLECIAKGKPKRVLYITRFGRDVSRSLWTLERRSLRSSVSCTLHLHAA